MPDPRVVHVVVPAHDEEQLLPACLAALERARTHTARHLPALTLRATVVLDRCSDGSAAVVARHPWVHALTTRSGSVGAARCAGVEHAAALAPGVPDDRVWIAGTDADSEVPRDWITHQVELAGEGNELVVGCVRPDPGDLPAGLLEAWRARHRLAPGHAHVHGAHLGFTLAAYRAVGGFPAVPVGEDVLLVEAMRAAGRRSCATTATVLTSGRLTSRTVGGFASYLHALAEVAG